MIVKIDRRFEKDRQIQPPSAIFLLGIKLAKKTSLGVLN